MENLDKIKSQLEYLEHIRKMRAKANLRYYHKRMSEDENYKMYLRQKAKERYHRKKQQQQNQQ